MTASQELLDYVADARVPDKDTILKMRSVAGKLTGAMPDSDAGHRMMRSLNDAYLMLQLARLADDPILIRNCQQKCIAVIDEIDRLRAPAASPTRQ